MDTVSIKDLRNNLAQLIEEVAIAKKYIKVTKFGKNKAVIVPVDAIAVLNKSAKQVDWAHSPAFGLWKDRKEMKDSSLWVKKLRLKESYRPIR